MSSRAVVTCDYPDAKNPGEGVCGKHADNHFEAKLGALTFDADFCTDHRAKFIKDMAAIGARASHALLGRKRRDVHIGKSGIPFSTSEARHWLIAKGIAVSAGPGRISQEHLDLYAKSH